MKIIMLVSVNYCWVTNHNVTQWLKTTVIYYYSSHVCESARGQLNSTRLIYASAVHDSCNWRLSRNPALCWLCLGQLNQRNSTSSVSLILLLELTGQAGHVFLMVVAELLENNRNHTSTFSNFCLYRDFQCPIDQTRNVVKHRFNRKENIFCLLMEGVENSTHKGYG